MGTGRTNRVAPDGTFHAVTARGAVFGNRGVLLDARGDLARPWRETRWISCVLQFRGRRRRQWQPTTYTELYFLDEATALAAGHRPCAECRRPAYEAFRAAWQVAFSSSVPPSAPQLDAVLHADRWDRDRPRRHRAAFDSLPGGVMVAVDGSPWLVDGDRLRRWDFTGYRDDRPRPGGDALVLTPRATVEVLRAGYRPTL